MKISELARRSGVPLPTIKFYIREGLLPPGKLTAKNQATYGDEHLERLLLIGALRDDAGLSVASIARALSAADRAGSDFVVAAIDAIERPSGPAVDEEAEEFQEARAALLELGRALGWEIDPSWLSFKDAARALAIIGRSFPAPARAEIVASILPYAKVARELAECEIPDDWAPAEAPQATLRYAVLGTVLFEPLILALRRMAHTSRATILERRLEGGDACKGANDTARGAKRPERRRSRVRSDPSPARSTRKKSKGRRDGGV